MVQLPLIAPQHQASVLGTLLARQLRPARAQAAALQFPAVFMHGKRIAQHVTLPTDATPRRLQVLRLLRRVTRLLITTRRGRLNSHLEVAMGKARSFPHTMERRKLHDFLLSPMAWGPELDIFFEDLLRPECRASLPMVVIQRLLL
jgi:hypothetical protein